MRFLLNIALMSACIGFAGCERSDLDDEAERQSEYAKMTAAIKRSLDSSKKCELVARNSPYLELAVMVVRDFTLMVEHRDAMMKDPLIGDYRFMVRWQRGQKYRKMLELANYGLWVLKVEVEVLRSNLDEACGHAGYEPDARSELFGLLEESRRLHDAIRYAEDVLADPQNALSGEFYAPRFVHSFQQLNHQLDDLLAN